MSDTSGYEAPSSDTKYRASVGTAAVVSMSYIGNHISNRESNLLHPVQNTYQVCMWIRDLLHPAPSILFLYRSVVVPYPIKSDALSGIGNPPPSDTGCYIAVASAETRNLTLHRIPGDELEMGKIRNIRRRDPLS